MSDRICPECGSDIYRASHYDRVSEARDRHWRKNQEQAIEILRLQTRVAELEDERRYPRGRKQEMQRRTIRRLEAKLRDLGVWPHDDRQTGEGDPASPAPSHDLLPHSPPPDYPDSRGQRKMRRRTKPKSSEGGDLG